MSKQKKLSKKQKKQQLLRKKRRQGFLLFLLVLVILASIALGVRYFVFEPVKMKTNAMSAVNRTGSWTEQYAASSDYRKGDTVIVNKLMDVTQVRRGDLVYVRFAANDSALVRRVAGVEGDEVITREDGDKWLVPAEGTPVNLGAAEGLAGGILQADQFLMLADDLGESGALDSRQLGLVTSASFIGTPGKIIWPPSRMFR
ncbi:MAG: hypothetical protein II920_09615 [Clostridia bacterium]|nr:hypothetical protein [Clostridia bacterium]